MLFMLLPVHILAGGLAIVLGAVALAVSKGGAVHRRSGLLFVYAMLTMGISGSILAARQSLTNTNVLGGFMSAYFVVTALTTVRPVSVWTRRLNSGALVVAIALSAIEIGLGVKAVASPGGTINGVPFFMMFLLGTITALAAAGDIRTMRSRERCRASAGAASVAHVLRAVHRGRIVFFHPRARCKDPSRALYDTCYAGPSHSAGVHRDVLLALACPCGAHVSASAVKFIFGSHFETAASQSKLRLRHQKHTRRKS